MRNWLRKLRGILGNATLWAGVWSLATIPVLGVLYLLGFGEMFGVGGILTIAPRIAASLAAMGFVAGGAFSSYLALAPVKRLDELNPRVVGIIGGLFAGIMVPIFGFLPGVAAVLGTPFSVAMGGAVGIAALLGGATAVGSVRVAQVAALESGDEDPERELGAGSKELSEHSSLITSSRPSSS